MPGTLLIVDDSPAARGMGDAMVFEYQPRQPEHRRFQHVERPRTFDDETHHGD